MHVDAFLHVLKWVSILSVNLSARVKHVSHALLGVAVKVFFVCSLLPDPPALRYKLQAVQWCLQDMHCLVTLTFPLETIKAALGTLLAPLCCELSPDMLLVVKYTPG